MSFPKKLIVSLVAIAMLVSLLVPLPLSREWFGFDGKVSAAGTGSRASIDTLIHFHEALNAGDLADQQAVEALRNEITNLDTTDDLWLIDPIWDKISLKLPASADQMKMKKHFFQFLKDLRLYLLNPLTEDLEQIRTNSDYISMLKSISSAAGQPSLTVDDFLLFLLGDAGGRPGVEGTLRQALHDMSPQDLNQVLQDKQAFQDLLRTTQQQVLALAEQYQVSRVLRNLGVKAELVLEAEQRFATRLQKDDAAFVPLAIAYIRMNTTTFWTYPRSGFDGESYRYTLNIFGAYIAPQLTPLSMEKVSGSPDLVVSPLLYDYIGSIVLSNSVRSAAAVIQIKLLHPYGGEDKVIYEKEVRHARKLDVSSFPTELFFDQIAEQYQALNKDAAGLQAVRNLQEEIAALDEITEQSLLDPVWNKIEGQWPLPNDKNEAKLALFQMLKEIAGMSDVTSAEDMLDFLNNSAYNSALAKFVHSYSLVNVNDLLIFLYGDGFARKGVSGAWIELLADQSPEDLIGLLQDEERRNSLLYAAIQSIYSQTDEEYYKFSVSLNKMGVTMEDIWSVIQQFQAKLQYDEAASRAKLLAYLRSHAAASESVSEDGRESTLALTILGKSVPSTLLTWSIISGSNDVTVSSNGVVSIPEDVAEVSAVIQASIPVPNSGVSHVIFEKEVTLVNKEYPPASDPLESYIQLLEQVETKLLELKKKLSSATGEEQTRILEEIFDLISQSGLEF